MRHHSACTTDKSHEPLPTTGNLLGKGRDRLACLMGGMGGYLYLCMAMLRERIFVIEKPAREGVALLLTCCRANRCFVYLKNLPRIICMR